ncbi:hypothetical protein [Peribacillus kribbensis]|uniref:hypothetical protein n=1 Tax=Peribacillus kribbensis TaxID=356658 RepID=UPI00047ECE3B|nr:hypothetical protein [Peribacillus kribbensis]
MNDKLNEFKKEIQPLEEQLHSIVIKTIKVVFMDIALMSMPLSQGQVQQQAYVSYENGDGEWPKSKERLFKS